MFYITLLIAKLISLISKTLKQGAGHTYPAHIALKIYPKIEKKILKKLPDKIVLITGTNGKTTTSKLLTYFLEQDGQKVLHNSSGANLLNGILSCLLINSDMLGRLKFDVAVLEVDELFLPVLLEMLYYSKKNLDQTHIMMLNVSRDQLDRHFEPDIVLSRWKEAITEFGKETNVYFDTTQDYFIPLAESLPNSTVRFFDDNPIYLHKSNLQGSHNAKNINAALLVVPHVGASVEISVSSLSEFEHAYGRGEIIKYKEKNFRVYLAKNPASFNHNLEILKEDDMNKKTPLLFILNDNIPDGRDVSWIYDISTEMLLEVCADRIIFITGTRGLEMAIRLDYAGVKILNENVFTSISQAIKSISKDTSFSFITALPNYSSMLELRKILTGRKIL